MAHENFQGVSSKFRVSLLDGGTSERAQVEVGLEGVKILSEDGRRTLRIYPLNHISRWALREQQLLLYVKTPVDVEERTVTLQADSETTRNVLDTLTCSCMQMCELLQNESGGGSSGRNNKEAEQNATWAANIMGGSTSSGARKAADSVEFWHHSDKEGWLQSQGEKIKTWRRRWHVLKEGYLFRFMEGDVDASSKLRGVLDLADVTEVSDAPNLTSKSNAFKIVTPKGNFNYIADSETEKVEWISALEAAICKIHDEKDPNPPPQRKQPAAEKGSAGSEALLRQLQKSYTAASSSLGGQNGSVKVVGYDGPAPGGDRPKRQDSGSGFRNYPNLASPGGYGASAPPPTDDFASLSLGYGIAGAHAPASDSLGFSRSMSGGGKQYNYSGYGGGGGVTISDPNYGGTDLASFGNPRDSPSYRNAASSQPIPVSGYDVFSYAPDHPSSNYPSMTAAVADYGPQAGYQGGYQGGMQPAGSGPQLQDYGPPPPAQDPHAAQMGDGWGGGWQPAAAQPPQAYPAAWEQPQGPPGPGGGDSWQVCYTPEGHQYWHNTATGLTQWEPPAGVA